MYETYVEEISDGVLFFIYDWESTTGDKNDLINCSIREKVDYQGCGNPCYWPLPPWACYTDNPEFGNTGSATSNEMYDFHWPGNLPGPYQNASVIAEQEYQYHCGPNCCMGPDEWCPLLEIGPIMRFVTGGEEPFPDLWRYSIIKSGAYAEIFPL
jgi:hypothetical protein